MIIQWNGYLKAGHNGKPHVLLYARAVVYIVMISLESEAVAKADA